jgi:hypothetical protein
MIVTRPARLALLSMISATALLMAGCAPHYYGPPPPPPPGVSSLIVRADHEGFRAGRDDGARDAYYRTGYHPQRDRAYHDTPGYEPELGPYGPYREAFRRSYLQGYDQGFHRG